MTYLANHLSGSLSDGKLNKTHVNFAKSLILQVSNVGFKPITH